MFIAAGVLAGLVGCDDSSKKQVQVKPPQIALPEQKPVQVAPPVEAQRKVAPPVAAPIPSGPEQVATESQAAFDAGEQDFKAGHLGKAREEFDNALDRLLASGFDLDTDPRLSGLYHHIIDTVSLDELEAFRAGDGFSEQKSTPAPIDEIAEQPIPQPEKFDPNLRGRAEGEVGAIDHDLPLTVNDPVLAYLNYFKTPRGSAIVETGLRRAGRYREMVRRVLKEEGLPQDLIYLAQAESAFLPQAVSKAGARGMWQFMSFAGRKYGLQKTWWVDERQDPEKATRAAARDLRDLYDQFGDWYLAMAAYNSGPGTVQHAVQRTGYADFWELYKRGVLPGETRNYVPIIIAITIMSKNPAQYGLDSVQLDPPLASDPVTISYPVDLRLVAECVDSSVDKLQELNPSLLRMTTPKDQSFVLHVPAGSKEKFEQEIASIPMEKRVLWRFHRVQPGDTLQTIARKYHVSSEAIAEANALPDDEVRAEAKLIIPVATGRTTKESATTDVGGYSKRSVAYKVRKGDTLSSIANDYGVPAEKIRKWNHLTGTAVKPGRVLHIYKPAAEETETASSTRTLSKRAAPELAQRTSRTSASGKKSTTAAKTPTHHTVKRGETLTSIASQYNLSVAELKKNNPAVAKLRAGDVLVIRR